jgi:hypothetical protein
MSTASGFHARITQGGGVCTQTVPSKMPVWSRGDLDARVFVGFVLGLWLLGPLYVSSADGDSPAEVKDIPDSCAG